MSNGTQLDKDIELCVQSGILCSHKETVWPNLDEIGGCYVK